MVYYIIWGMVALLMLAGYYSNNKSHRAISAYLIIIIVTLFAGLRYERWSDWEGYYDLFYSAGSLDRDIEFGFELLCRIGHVILRNFNLFLCVVYLVVFILHYLEYKDSVPKMSTFCLFVFVSVSLLTSGGMREFIAVGITLYSIRFIRNKNLKAFIVTVIIAAFFHRTAVFFLPAYWIDKIRLDKKRVIIYSIICIILARAGIFSYMLSNIAPLFNRFPSFAYRIRLYAYSMQDFNIISMRFIKRTLLLVIALIVSPKDQDDTEESHNRRIYVNLFTVGYFISILVPGQFARIGGYYSVAEPLIESYILLNIQSAKNRFLMLLFFVVMYLANWINTLNTFYPDLLIPYRSILFK